MGDKLRMELESGQNPFKFQQYDKLDTIAEATTPLVIIASPGMLQNGPSRELFVKWAPDPKNGVIFTGYSVEGSLAKKVIDSDKTIVVGESIINREMSVNYESFSAHADFLATQDYIEILQPPNIVLVHGD
jgi:cleavage and polyadenylation specificity factor subunit 3